MQKLESSQAGIERNSNLDLVRFVAILMVTMYHIVQRAPLVSSAIKDVFDYGKYGVDLFFVLSGYLIGTIFWTQVKEKKVSMMSFWRRRLTRTVPPYLVALGISYFGVYYFRGQAFNFGYLIFLQNYYNAIPYFLVSWSLCIEEHFYLLFPLLFYLAKYTIMRLFLFFLLIVSTFAFRVLESNHIPASFGYYETATHLRLDGITLGFLIPFLRCNYGKIFSSFEWLMRNNSVFYVSIIVAGIACGFSMKSYAAKYLLISTVCFLFVIKAVASRSRIISSFRFITFGATTSYSVYLTQAIALDFSERLIRQLNISEYFYVPFCFGVIYGIGSLFYFLVERPTLILRNKIN